MAAQLKHFGGIRWVVYVTKAAPVQLNSGRVSAPAAEGAISSTKPLTRSHTRPHAWLDVLHSSHSTL